MDSYDLVVNKKTTVIITYKLDTKNPSIEVIFAPDNLKVLGVNVS